MTSAPVSQICWAAVASPLGLLYVARSDRGVCRLDLHVDRAGFLARLGPAARPVPDPPALADVAAQLRAYFQSPAGFDLPLDLAGLTAFQQDVLQAARRIPLGTVWTYGELARAIGRPRSSRAVGQALGRNPVLIIIPCHRVIASAGGLGGYSGGRPVKRFLLQWEGLAFPGLAEQ